jgi:hypothetical protein
MLECHRPLFFARPHLARRRFFRILGAGVSGYFVAPPALAGEVAGQLRVTPQNKARNVIFILLSGAMSQIDTFDFKNVAGVTPASFAPENVNGIGLFPTGLFPKLKSNLGDLAIVRSLRAYALVHGLARTWVQIGRNPTSALGAVAPNIGSVVALELEGQRQPSQVFPTFLALNSGDAIGAGYFPARYAPFKAEPSAAGLRNTTSTAAGGAGVFNDRFNILHLLDDPYRIRSPFGKPAEDLDAFYTQARAMVDHPAVAQAFAFSTSDSQRYGSTSFGNACLVAKQVLAVNQGTRYIQLTLGGWDHHQDIYDATDGLPPLCKILDDGLSALLADLKSSGLLGETLVLMQGEFGRTVGPLTGDGGRDHYLQQFAVFAGAGIRGGRALGRTDPTGAFVEDSGWSRNREVRSEDIESTVLSALGIDWTKIRYDDPFGRGFEYVPYAKDDLYGPINELWG